ncbi:hypothetical protein GCM10025865_07490 [Paraoerskovia sediminicola]|uniref:Uncharacterized protein n=1 Tax=Paraoerskovia sediminicola TaxID=1138587 RepID=A0ABN6X9V3_9CELL|nr:hypothetical protein GCM10025865_07490 [Paraoerskovia sediminicola]
MACTGGTVAARRAGTAAAARLTPTPPAIATVSCAGPRGTLPANSMPCAARTRWIRATSPAPATIPAAAPRIPTATACARIDRNTCWGEAPRARRRASSRIRSRTDIVKVLVMMNAPTNSEIAAKISRNVSTNPRICSTLSLASSRAWSPVTASASAGSTCATRSARSASSTPGSPYTAIVETVPSGAKASTAVGSSRPTRIAPAAEASIEKVPTTVTSRGPSPSTTCVVSPVVSPAVVAAESSRTIWSRPCGQAPEDRLSPGSCGLTAKAVLGGRW